MPRSRVIRGAFFGTGMANKLLTEDELKAALGEIIAQAGPEIAEVQRARTPARDKLEAHGIDEVCQRVADCVTLQVIADDVGVSKTALIEWLDGYSDQYARARLAQADKMAEDILALADTSRIGTKTTTKPDGTVETVTADMVDRSRLQIDARKWLAAKMAPKKYGDRLELAGALELKKSAADMTDDELMDIASGRNQNNKAK